MAGSGGKATFSAAAASDAARGTGGKLKRQTARRHTTTTPYSRPPQNQVQRSRPWISRIVDPAYRAISSGATKLLPYFFSSAPESEEQQHQDKLQDDLQENDPSSVTPSLNEPKSESIEEGGTSSTSNIKESNFNISAQAISNRAKKDGDAISELERLMHGKTFSLAETDRLIEIINSRAIDLPDVAREDIMEIPTRERAKKSVSFLDQKEEPSGDKDAGIDLWATPTPLAKSVTFEGGKRVGDEAGLSPAELAKAYMGGQAPSSSSQGFVARNESLDQGMLVANSSGASPSSKPSAGWPGVKLNEQSGFATPQSQRENFGIRSFPRTPYPRSILSGSKSQLMQLQDNSRKRLNTLQSPSQSVQTRYGQLKLNKGSDGGLFGPSRRSRQSATMSPYSRPSRGRFENSANKKISEAGESSNLSVSQTTTFGKHIGLEAGTPTVPRHSSQIAKTILDHLERTLPTPKNKSDELKLATSWRFPESSKTVEQSSSNINKVNKDGPAKLNEDIPKFFSHNPPSSVPKLSEVPTGDIQNTMAKTASASNGILSGSSSGTTLQYELGKPKDATKAVSYSFGGEPANFPKPPSHSLGNNKRSLSSISVAKPTYQRWAVPSGSNASFTFPVSSSSDGAATPEPTTPSIMPSTTTPSGGVAITSQHEATKDDEIPQFGFGGNRRGDDKLPLVFAFPSMSDEMNNEKLGDIKFTFGSNKAERISFGSPGSDGVSQPQWRRKKTRFMFHLNPNTKFAFFPRALSSSDNNDGSVSSSRQNNRQMGYDPSEELFGVDFKPRNVSGDSREPRSWFGPNGQYIRELPCPTCRGRGYTSCPDCGIERARLDCPQCKGKGIMTCLRCLGDCVIWEESIDERPWEKARSSSPFRVKEDDEVDNLEIKFSPRGKSKRIYQSPPPEVGQKISRSLKSLNAKTGLFSNRMKIIHGDPVLHAQRVAAIKKAKGTPAARKHASETMKTFFSNAENREKRSLSMKGVKFYCKNCGQEGHRRFYCPELDTNADRRFRCRVCGGKGHNRRTCPKSKSMVSKGISTRNHQCGICGESGHNSRTCRKLARVKTTEGGVEDGVGKRVYACGFCKKMGHNVRTCPSKRVPDW
uniref:CCHC-type domain-containing protein n=3 Tax=Brassica TaxID=3705 RepID=A0A0D3EDV4_BRAOL